MEVPSFLFLLLISVIFHIILPYLLYTFPINYLLLCCFIACSVVPPHCPFRCWPKCVLNATWRNLLTQRDREIVHDASEEFYDRSNTLLLPLTYRLYIYLYIYYIYCTVAYALVYSYTRFRFTRIEHILWLPFSFFIFSIKFTKISFDYFCILLLLLLLLFYCIIYFWDARDAAATPARHDLPNALTSRVRTERDSPLATQCQRSRCCSRQWQRCCQRRCRLQRRQ